MTAQPIADAIARGENSLALVLARGLDETCPDEGTQLLVVALS